MLAYVGVYKMIICNTKSSLQYHNTIMIIIISEWDVAYLHAWWPMGTISSGIRPY